MVKKIKKKKDVIPASKVRANLPVLFLKEEKMFVAYSPALDLSTCGDTYEEAQKNFEEALLIFFEEVIRYKTLHDVLTSLGWKETKNKWVPPSYIGQVNVPLPEISAFAN
jgi:predicted RNase H-like HicB family nuclease